MISIIIPTFNEAKKISATINYLLAVDNKKNIREIIIADGGSPDNTVEIAQKLSALTNITTNKNRAAQLNAGAAMANGEILFFLHADSIPPKDFIKKIIDAVDKKYYSDCYLLIFILTIYGIN